MQCMRKNPYPINEPETLLHRAAGIKQLASFCSYGHNCVHHYLSFGKYYFIIQRYRVTYFNTSLYLCELLPLHLWRNNNFCDVLHCSPSKESNSPLASIPNHRRPSDVIGESFGRHTIFRQTPTSSISYGWRHPRTLPSPRQHLHRTESDHHILIACLVFMDHYHWTSYSTYSCLPVGMVHDDNIKGPCPLCFLGITM